MTPNQLYAREPESVSESLLDLSGAYYNHVPEIEDVCRLAQPSNSSRSGRTEGARVQLRYYKNFDFDGRRVWRLASVWFDGKPVMIFQNAGREGDDWAYRYVTDRESYVAMVGYLAGLKEPNTAAPNTTWTDPDVEVVPMRESVQRNSTLTSFYGYSLEGHFARY